MRLSMLPSLAMNMKQNYGKKDVLKLFEIAKAYSKREGELPDEQYQLCVAVNTDFYDLKGDLQALFASLNLGSIVFEEVAHQAFHPGKSAEIVPTDKT